MGGGGEDFKNLEGAGQEGEQGKQLLDEKGDVILSREQYDALLERVDELESSASRISRSGREGDVDELLGEIRKGVQAPAFKEQQQPEKDLDEMSNRELISLIIGAVKEEGQTLKIEVEALKVAREIDKVEFNHKEDFHLYEQRMYEIAQETPNITMERAFKLAKAELGDLKPAKGANGDDKEPRTRTEKMLGLPPRGSFGDRPGISRAAAQEPAKADTLKDAAEMAWEKVMGDKKNV